jgi:hypothetical protein
MLTRLVGLSIWFVLFIGFDSPLETLPYLHQKRKLTHLLLQTISGSHSLAKDLS